jgi:acyl-CoA synthetase (AMP-forming)/AMP-acid ligase II
VASSAEDHAERDAIGFLEQGEVRHWSYAELKRRIDAFAEALGGASPLS